MPIPSSSPSSSPPIPLLQEDFSSCPKNAPKEGAPETELYNLVAREKNKFTVSKLAFHFFQGALLGRDIVFLSLLLADTYDVKVDESIYLIGSSTLGMGLARATQYFLNAEPGLAPMGEGFCICHRIPRA